LGGYRADHVKQFSNPIARSHELEPEKQFFPVVLTFLFNTHKHYLVVVPIWYGWWDIGIVRKGDFIHGRVGRPIPFQAMARFCSTKECSLDLSELLGEASHVAGFEETLSPFGFLCGKFAGALINPNGIRRSIQNLSCLAGREP
jgi:hypothetical protein